MISLVVLALWALPNHPPPPGLPVSVQAVPDTHYFAKCHIRTFKAPVSEDNRGEQGYVNTYYIDSKGLFSDKIPSPNVQCVFGKVKGAGPVTLHIFKQGDHAVTVNDVGQWMRLNVW